MSVAKLFDFLFDKRYGGIFFLYDFSDKRAYDFHVVFFEASCRGGRSAESYAAGNKGSLRIVGYCVFVGSYVSLVQKMLYILTRCAVVVYFNQHQMVVSAARYQFYTVFRQRIS